jgi:hypothetical protein
MVFIGYEDGTKGYRMLEPLSKTLHISRDVIFEESQAWNWNIQSVPDQPEHFVVEYPITDGGPTIEEPVAVSAPAGPVANSPVQFQPQPSPDHSQVLGSPHTPSTSASHVAGQNQWVTPPAGQSADSEGVPLRYRTLTDLFDSTEELQDFEYSGVCFLAADEPASVEQALEETCWKNAMEAELQSIRDNNTWSLSELPKGHKAIGLKWVFKVKKDAAGNIVKHKARLVAKGYAQKQGVDYDEVFAPVARIETVRILLALAAHGDWELHHMDVKSAFLNGDLQEHVYVHQPPGFADAAQSGKVLKLNKALYGLKQAPRAWNSRLDQELKAMGFQKSIVEHAVYKRGTGDALLLIGVYVDDLIICGPNSLNIKKFEDQMKRIFSMGDLGLLSYYLGMEVKQGRNQITICQKAYAEKIVEMCNMSRCNPVDTPMEQRVKLTTSKPGTELDVTRYRSLIGSLRYLVNTRPDLAYAVGIASRFMEAPGREHWAVVKRIVRYIAGTLDYGCKYMKGEGMGLNLLGYTDSDCSGDLVHRKSTSGIIFYLGTNLVTWASQKQKVVALSSCEAEYIAAALGACQGVWLSRLIADLVGGEAQKFRLLIDNQSAIELAKNPVFHERSKHIDTRFHYIRDCIERNMVDVEHVGTEDQVADILTKPLGRVKFVEFRLKLGVVPVKQD